MVKVDTLVKETVLSPEDIKIGEKTCFEACVHKIRDMGSIAFVILRTGRFLFQGICDDVPDGVKEGCYVRVEGNVIENPKAPHGKEMKIEKIETLSAPAAEYPLKISKYKMGCPLSTNLQYRSVALRNPLKREVFRVSEGICEGFREFMREQGFTEVHTPKLTSVGAEGGANIFRLKYFGQDATLAQSPQFYKQTCVAFFDRVYEIAPVYRAEKHNTVRHLNEYIGLDFEMAYINDMYDIMRMETAMLKYVVEYLKKNCAPSLELLNAQLPEIGEIPALTFFEAAELLGGKKNRYDLDPEEEVELCKYAKEKYGSEFVFITHFPEAKRPFYAMDNKNDPKLAESFDLLFRGLEITTGGQRIHDYGEQVAKLERRGMNPDDFASYLDIHKYGMPPHGGLGIGLERLTMKMLGLENVREASLFPRDTNHLIP